LKVVGIGYKHRQVGIFADTASGAGNPVLMRLLDLPNELVERHVK